MSSANEKIKKLGKLIFKLRRDKGFSQEELGKRTNSSQMTIQRLENGSGGTRMETILAVAEELDTTLVSLLQHIEKPSSEVTPKDKDLRKFIEQLEKISTKKQKWLLELFKVALQSP